MNASIEIAAPKTSRAHKVVEFAYHAFLRLLALFFFAFTIHTWLSAIGFWDGASFRFDTMTTQQRIYTSILLVLHPVTAVGLWTTLSWGRVIWILAVGVQVVAMLYYSAAFPMQNELMFFHLGSLVLYVIFEIAMKLVAKKA